MALDAAGVSRFQSLQQALKSGDVSNLIYFVFDLPYAGGYNLMECELVERRRLLQDMLSKIPATKPQKIRFSDAIAGSGHEVLRQACRLHLEGIIAKRATSRYVSDRTDSWRKVKCGHRQEFVIGGFTRPRGARSSFGALLLGYYTNSGQFKYAGKVGAGFNEETLRDIGQRLEAIERTESSYSDVPRMSGQRWVAPRLVVEIAFTEWTADGRLRHPVFVAMREDKEAADVTRERTRALKPRSSPKAKTRKAVSKDPRPAGAAPKRAAAPDEAVIAKIRITHPERVVYLSRKLTKLDVARYYESISKYMLPLIADRPLSLVRCPAGQTAKCFFQKHPDVQPGSGLDVVQITESGGPAAYATVSTLAGLMSLVQMNTLELHAWGSRADDVERPDRLVFDLDPGEGVKWNAVVKTASELRDIFARLKMKSFLMTSGGKGLHVVTPIERRIEWDAAKSFVKSIAEALATAHPDLYVANMSKAKRRGRVFIDYLRVQRGATSIAPYSTRAREGAPVAMPIEWDQASAVAPGQFTIENALDHIAARPRDPWAGYARTRQRIPAAFIPG